VTHLALKAVSKTSANGDEKGAHAKYELTTEQFPKWMLLHGKMCRDPQTKEAGNHCQTHKLSNPCFC